MNMRELERELTAVLHRHAEDAMNRTNTQVEHQKLQSVGADHARTDRRHWVFGGVAAAVAAAAVGVALWSSDPGGDRSSPPVAQAPDSTGTADLVTAENFAAAFADHDAAAAAPYLAPGTEAPWSTWRAELKRNEAWGVEYLMKPCTETSIATLYTCPYAMHLLGSRQVGKGPFLNNTLTVNLDDDGTVTSALPTIPFETNGFQQHVESVHAWIAENHPQDEPFLMEDQQDVRPTDWPRWTQLWKHYTREYVAATNKAG